MLRLWACVTLLLAGICGLAEARKNIPGFLVDSQEELIREAHDHQDAATQHDELGHELFPATSHHRLRFRGETFILTRNVNHGEQEVRVYDGGDVIAMETTIRKLGENALFLREASDGRKIVQMIYTDGRHLAECDVTKDPLLVDKFIGKFLEESVSDVNQLRERYKRHSLDVTALMLAKPAFTADDVSLQLPRHLVKPYSAIADLDELKDVCIALHKQQRRQQKQHIAEKMLEEQERDEEEVDDVDGDDEEVDIAANPSPARRSRGHGRRTKRSMLIYPGTKWCGRGFTASNYTDLGESVDADRCCRQHDHCPHMIEGFESRWNLFNYRFTTISHCHCDETFRTCLRTARTDVSHMVGRLFFNIVGARCFIFKPQDVCVERSWWRCTRYEKQLQAEVLDEIMEY